MLNLNKASPKQIKGQEIESLVCQYLQDQGLQLLIRNFRCRLGEMDWIGLDKDQLMFLEIRFRRNTSFGGGAASVDFRKQQKLIKTAKFFLRTHPNFTKHSCRFDVVAVTLKDNTPQIEWIPNAFY